MAAVFAVLATTAGCGGSGGGATTSSSEALGTKTDPVSVSLHGVAPTGANGHGPTVTKLTATQSSSGIAVDYKLSKPAAKLLLVSSALQHRDAVASNRVPTPTLSGHAVVPAPNQAGPYVVSAVAFTKSGATGGTKVATVAATPSK